MALEKKVVYRQQVDEFGNISVQRAEQIWEDGELHSKRYHRHVVAPGEINARENDAVTKEIAKVVHTPEVISIYEAKMAELREGE